jgi:prepilin-type N-terminal cleavage/methylation domain-containing protein
MKNNQFKNKGFTLVELAIVLMIIGLLIGGILKGQELITNARILTVTRQLKSYEAAIITFQDAYGALPGDITNPSTRVPDCTTTPCSSPGNGNGYWDDATTENVNVWIHMAKANLISGVDTSATTMDTVSPPTSLGGMVTAPLSARLSFILKGPGSIGGRSPSATAYVLIPSYAARIDRKLDDGMPYTGSVYAYATTGCLITTAGVTNYNETTTTPACALNYYLQ